MDLSRNRPPTALYCVLQLSLCHVVIFTRWACPAYIHPLNSLLPKATLSRNVELFKTYQITAEHAVCHRRENVSFSDMLVGNVEKSFA